MNETFLITNNNKILLEQTNLPSFITFNPNSNQFLPTPCFSDGFFAYQRTDSNHRKFTKEEEDDSVIQYSVPSNSSMSTPDIVNSLYPNHIGLNNLSLQRNFEHGTGLWLKVDFLSPTSFFYKDVDKPSNAAKLSYLPNRENPVLYVEKGRFIELVIETNFSPPTNSFLRFDIYSLRGTKEEPVYGSSNDSSYNSTGHCTNKNLCFIQATEEEKVSARYIKSDDGFVYMTVPLKQSSLSISVVFPFLNFKCQTSSKKTVFLKISVLNESSEITSRKFQLVSCTSPNRDFKRHFEKLNGIDNNVVPKKIKTNDSEDGNKCIEDSVTPQRQSITDNPQYVIMTENYDIWKILHIVHQQLNEHFNSTKK